MIALAVDGPTPGKVSSCSTVAVLMFTLPDDEDAAPAASVVPTIGFTGGVAPGTVTGGSVARDGRNRGATVADGVRCIRRGTNTCSASMMVCAKLMR